MNQARDQIKDTQKLNQVISRYRGQPGELLSVLEEIQKLNRHQYLPYTVLEYVAEKTGIPLSRIYSVVTFYSFFNLKPLGDHCVTICRGTACHTKGSKKILDSLKTVLDFADEDFAEGEKMFITTRDNMFTIRTVACFGQCALAPVIEVDGIIYGHMTVEKAKKIITDIKRKGRRK